MNVEVKADSCLLCNNTEPACFMIIHNWLTKSNFLLTCLEGSSLAVHPSISLTPTSKRGLMTPHLFSLPFNSTTIFPDLWSSTNSNSPMYPRESKFKKITYTIKGYKVRRIWISGKKKLCLWIHTMLLHNLKELDDHFWGRSDHHLTLSPLLCIVHALEGIIQNANSHHLL